jgi:hypothetical protein
MPPDFGGVFLLLCLAGLAAGLALATSYGARMRLD